MTANDFIFSNTFRHKFLRHSVFWILYCSYFYIQSLPPRKFEEFFVGRTYYIALMNLCCFAPVFIGAVYFFIYFLLPRTLQRKKYILFAFLFLLVYAMGTFINFFTATAFLYYTNYFPLTLEHQVEMSNFNTRWGMVIAIVALGIKSSKNWYLQQQENLELLKKKTRAEMQLQKSRIHPQLLLRSLSSIYTNLKTKPANASNMILNLSELLSYSLYETSTELVPLEKELQELDYLIALEQRSGQPVYIQMHLQGEVNEKYIAPMIVVKLVEEILTELHGLAKEDFLLDVNVVVYEKNFLLTIDCSDDKNETIKKVRWTFLNANLRKRLEEFYVEDSFKIELREDEQETLLSLNIDLSACTKNISDAFSPIIKPVLYGPA